MIFIMNLSHNWVKLNNKVCTSEGGLKAAADANSFHHDFISKLNSFEKECVSLVRMISMATSTNDFQHGFILFVDQHGTRCMSDGRISWILSDGNQFYVDAIVHLRLSWNVMSMFSLMIADDKGSKWVSLWFHLLIKLLLKNDVCFFSEHCQW